MELVRKSESSFFVDFFREMSIFTFELIPDRSTNQLFTLLFKSKGFHYMEPYATHHRNYAAGRGIHGPYYADEFRPTDYTSISLEAFSKDLISRINAFDISKEGCSNEVDDQSSKLRKDALKKTQAFLETLNKKALCFQLDFNLENKESTLEVCFLRAFYEWIVVDEEAGKLYLINIHGEDIKY